MNKAMAAVNMLGSILLLAVLSAAVVPSGASFAVPAIFVFGDSTVDVGNNNYLSGKNIANFKPYGIDYFNSQPTGRFSNGYTVIDYIAKYLGFKESPPALHSKAHKNSGFEGANFASAGSGVLNYTGSTPSMAQQVQHFKAHIAKMERQVEKVSTMWEVEKSLFVISTVSNDVFNFYQLKAANLNSNDPSYETSLFLQIMASYYKDHVLKLYNLGARKFAILNVGLIGCCPYSRTFHPSGECNHLLNQLAQSISNAIAAGMQELSSNLEGMKYSIGNSYNLMTSLILARPNSGMEVKSACCGKGLLNAQKMCSQDADLCHNRKQYLFWDMLHSTEEAARTAAATFFSGSNADFISPINFEQLVNPK